MSKNYNYNKLIGQIAYGALLISGIAFLLRLLEIGNLGILSTIASVLFIVVVLWTAWNYAKGLPKIWLYIFYVIAGLVILSLIL